MALCCGHAHIQNPDLFFFYWSMLSSPSLASRVYQKTSAPLSVWVCRQQLCQPAWYAAVSGLLRLPGWNLKALSATHRKPSSSMAVHSSSLILTARKVHRFRGPLLNHVSLILQSTKPEPPQEVILTHKHGEMSWCEIRWFQKGRTGQAANMTARHCS